MTIQGSVCDPSATSNGYPFDQCANDMFCRNLTLCARAPSLGPYRCAAPLGEGSVCDSDTSDYDSNVDCRPCAPGLRCERLAGTDLPRCVRSCSTNADCPCPGGATGTCATLASGAKACTTCVPLGEACDGYRRCCGAGEQCGPSNNTGNCCRSAGSPCTRVTECCGLVGQNAPACATSPSGNKTCQPCRDAGAACTSDDQCCDGGTCSGGFCRIACADGGSCKTSKKGACEAGHYECNEFGIRICVSNKAPAANDSSCNKSDDDCDGKVDEEYKPTECTKSITCGPTPFNAKGLTECKNGSETCQVQPGVSYCTTASGGACGAQFGEACSVAQKCGINLVCVQPSGPGQPNRCDVPAQHCPNASPSCYPLNSPYLGMCYPGQ